MERLTQIFQAPGGSALDDSLDSLVLSLLAAFVLGQALAWVYLWTHSGVSYSRAFTQSLILMSVVVTLVMYVIGNNIITAFGLIGAMAIIRFRNVLKDTRDTVFVFFVLVLGIAVGTQRYMTAFLGTAAFAALSLYLSSTSFGSLGRFDGYLMLRVAKGGDERDLVRRLQEICRSVKGVSTRHSGADDGVEYLFQVRLRDPRASHRFVNEVRSLAHVTEASLTMRDELVEV